MKKHSRGYRWGGLFGGAVYEAKALRVLVALQRKGDKVENLNEIFRDYIRRNFKIFRNALNPHRLRIFRA